MNISVVIPNYNGAELLKKNIPFVITACEKYREKTSALYEVIIVDDKSIDESIAVARTIAEEYEQKHIKIRIITRRVNEGFSSTVNKGVSDARYEIVVLLNTDVRPEITFLHPLLTHFHNEKVFAVGCVDKSIEKDGIVLRGRGIGRWERGFLIHRKGELSKQNTLWVGGGSGAFRKSIWGQLGGLDELYNPFYWEDIDLSYRAQKAGYSVLIEPESIVVHEHEKGAIKKSYSKDKVKTISYRNQIIFVWKNVTDLSIIFKHIFWLPYMLLASTLKRDWPFLQGLVQAIQRIPLILRQRAKIKGSFILSDIQVIDLSGK